MLRPRIDMAMKLSSLLFITLGALTLASTARAQIDRQGAHLKYRAEVEPHLVLQHTDDDGVGIGIRASFPIIDNGPVTTINNSLALGIGFDWSHWDDECPGPFDDCDGNDFWIPFVVQWNFFFSDLISAFPELGFALEYETWDEDYGPFCRGNDYCDDDGDIDVELVLWLGVRFHLAREVALTVRLGMPSILIGVSFFL
jgi:hypothetical protein